ETPPNPGPRAGAGVRCRCAVQISRVRVHLEFVHGVHEIGTRSPGIAARQRARPLDDVGRPPVTHATLNQWHPCRYPPDRQGWTEPRITIGFCLSWCAAECVVAAI